MSTLHNRSQESELGFSIVQVLIVFVIMAIVTTFALMTTRDVKTRLQLTNSRDMVTSYIQKIFTDARRRHAKGSERPQIRVTGLNTFQVSSDFGGSGTLETRTITLTDNVRFIYPPLSPPTATVDWRGNVAEGTVTFTLRSGSGEDMNLTLSGSGDTSDSALPAAPTITATTTSSDVNPSVVVNGNYTPNLDPSPTPVGTPLPTCTGSQVALTTPCRCQTGKHIDAASGKCK